MNKYLLLIILSFFSLADKAYGYDIVILKSSASKLNQDIQDVFTKEFNQRTPQGGLKTIQRNQIKDILMTKEEKGSYTSAIQSFHPDLILAIGSQALEEALLVPDVPVVHLLVVHPEDIITESKPVIGVSLSIPPKVQLDEMSSKLPKVKRVGIIYDPGQSSEMVEQMKALRPDLDFIALGTQDISVVPDLIHSLRGKVDLLWMLPDLTATNKITIQSYVLFSARNKIPLLTFSEKLLNQGATLAITFAIDEIAKQAAILAMDMLLHPIRREQTGLVPPPVHTKFNPVMAAKLGIPTPETRGTDE
jgi:putative ABC transport system substrate-binding protein